MFVFLRFVAFFYNLIFRSGSKRRPVDILESDLIWCHVTRCVAPTWHVRRPMGGPWCLQDVQFLRKLLRHYFQPFNLQHNRVAGLKKIVDDEIHSKDIAIIIIISLLYIFFFGFFLIPRGTLYQIYLAIQKSQAAKTQVFISLQAALLLGFSSGFSKCLCKSLQLLYHVSPLELCKQWNHTQNWSFKLIAREIETIPSCSTERLFGF